jgi:hypothetical protein
VGHTATKNSKWDPGTDIKNLPGVAASRGGNGVYTARRGNMDSELHIHCSTQPTNQTRTHTQTLHEDALDCQSSNTVGEWSRAQTRTTPPSNVGSLTRLECDLLVERLPAVHRNFFNVAAKHVPTGTPIQRPDRSQKEEAHTQPEQRNGTFWGRGLQG